LAAVLIYSPDSNNLNNFIAKLRAFKMAEENRELTKKDLKPFLVYARHLGFKNVIRIKKSRHFQNFLEEAMYS